MTAADLTYNRFDDGGCNNDGYKVYGHLQKQSSYSLSAQIEPDFCDTLALESERDGSSACLMHTLKQYLSRNL